MAEHVAGKPAFEIAAGEDGRISLSGRFDAAQVEKAKAVLDGVTSSTVVDFADLDYISSAGIGVLFAVHKRLVASGGGLRFVRLRPAIWEIFRIANFHKLIDIEPPPRAR